jgi:hypothetical protein
LTTGVDEQPWWCRRCRRQSWRGHEARRARRGRSWRGHVPAFTRTNRLGGEGWLLDVHRERSYRGRRGGGASCRVSRAKYSIHRIIIGQKNQGREPVKEAGCLRRESVSRRR